MCTEATLRGGRPMAGTVEAGASVSRHESGRGRNPGWRAVYWKEIADYLSGYRFLILLALVIVTGLASLYVGAQTLRDTLTLTGETDRFVFLRLFTTGSSSL